MILAATAFGTTESREKSPPLAKSQGDFGKNKQALFPPLASCHRPPMAKLSDEEKICGLHACRAVFARRKKDLRKIYLESSRVDGVKDILRYCAKNSIAYKIVPTEELEKITRTLHHEGIVFVARAPAAWTLDAIVQRWRQRFAAPETRASMLLLENVRDPHNVGAILRTAAHFGIDTVLTYGETSRRNAALLRTAEGGAEWLDWFEVQDLPATLAALRALGFACAATSSHGKSGLYDAPLPSRTLFMLGAEREGISAALQKEADLSFAIPGSGAVESLNVATATAVLLAEFQRQSFSLLRSPRKSAAPKAGAQAARRSAHGPQTKSKSTGKTAQPARAPRGQGRAKAPNAGAKR